MKWRFELAFGAALFCLAGTGCSGPRLDLNSLPGRWEGVIDLNGVATPFSFVIARNGGELTGSFWDGELELRSTKTRFDGKVLDFRFDYYDANLVLRPAPDGLQGTYWRQRGKQAQSWKVTFRRHAAKPRDVASAPVNVTGDWLFRATREDGRVTPMSARFEQRGADVQGTFLRVDGDLGVLRGGWDGGRLTLSKFDGVRGYRIELAPGKESVLEGTMNARIKLFGAPAADAARYSLEPLPDPANYTRVKNPEEPFRFHFEDLEERWVSNNDDRFRNKVVIVAIGGSWCPNCHDEAPVLVDLYRRYRDQGLEIVYLGFEYTGDPPRDRALLRVFVKRHGIEFPVLLAGTTDEGDVERKLPQLENFGAYPTTIYLGRDGKVREIHTGFEGPATGDRYVQRRARMEALVRKLLAEAPR